MQTSSSPHSFSAPRRLLTIVLVLALGACVTRVEAAEIILKNDSVAVPGAGTPLLAFVPGERIAVWLTTPTAGTIVGVQVLWDSLLQNNPASTETAIRISAAGTFPTPGAQLAMITAPVLADTTINEYRFLDPPANTSPLQVPVTAGQTFVVDLELLNQNAGNAFASGVEIDNDGVPPGRNAVFAIPGGWADAALLGVTGDFAIRAIIKPVPEPTSALLLWVGAALLFLARRRNRAATR